MGTLPSLDQIRNWSLRRQGLKSDSATDYLGSIENKSGTPSPAVCTNEGNLTTPTIQILGATPPTAPLLSAERLQALNVILEGTRRAASRNRGCSLPSSPVK